MRKPLRFLVLLLFPLSFCNSYTQKIENSIASLVPDVKRELKTDRTYLFSRAQFIYSLGSDNYLNKWVDRPLLVNTKLDANKVATDLMTLGSYEEMQRTALDYGLDGFAFFPQTSKRLKFYQLSNESSHRNFLLLNEVLTTDASISKAEIINKAINNPHSFRIGDKVVITSYNADVEDVSKWQTTLKGLAGQFPQKFLFIPSISNLAGRPITYWQKRFHANDVTAEDVDNIKTYLRSWATATDGLYFSNVASLQDTRRNFDQPFYKEFLIRIFKSVLSEPAFQNKYLGLSACIAHENATRLGYTLSSDGTKTLRSSLEAALSAKPDFINIPEWDEQNENTSLSPTVYNGFSSRSIVRYYAANVLGKKLPPLPTSNSNLPNLIVSYRKILTVGERLKIELLDVPDSDRKMAYNAKIVLKDITGNTVYTSPTFSFSGDQIKEEVITIPSEDFAGKRVLIPQVQLEVGTNATTIETGFQYIELRPSWNWDYKWVKQPVREVLKPAHSTFTLTPAAGKTKTMMATASIVTNEPLAQVELLDNNDVVYSYSKADTWRQKNDQVMISLNIQSFGGMQQGLNLKGKVSLENGKGNWRVGNAGSLAPVIHGKTLSLEKTRSSIWKQRTLIAVDNADVSTARLNINLPGIYKGNISVKEIIDKGVVGISGPKGLNLVISHYLRQEKIPANLNTTNVQFSVPVIPDLPNSIYHIQAISSSGNIYRSKPVFLETSGDTKASLEVYSDVKEAPVVVSVNKKDLPDIVYQFNPGSGSVLKTDAGRPFWGILGGYYAQATERGGGNAGDDIPFIGMKGYPENTSKSAPDWVPEGKGFALQFDGKGTFISLPQGVIPRRAGYTIEMDVYPENSAGKQVIIGNRSVYIGSLIMYIENGIVGVSFLGEKGAKANVSSGISLPVNQWSHLTIKYDQQNVMVSVGDKKSNLIEMKGPGLYETPTVVGGFGTEWFKGRIKSLMIHHGQ